MERPEGQSSNCCTGSTTARSWSWMVPVSSRIYHSKCPLFLTCPKASAGSLSAFATPKFRMCTCPTTTTSLLQPLNYVILPSIFQHTLDANKHNASVAAHVHCKSYNNVNAQQSMDELKITALNACWKKLWSEAVNGSHGVPTQHPDEIQIIIMSYCKVWRIQFPDFEKGDIQEILESYTDELSEEDLENLTALDKPDDNT